MKQRSVLLSTLSAPCCYQLEFELDTRRRISGRSARVRGYVIQQSHMLGMLARQAGAAILDNTVS